MRIMTDCINGHGFSSNTDILLYHHNRNKVMMEQVEPENDAE